ncbi:hypothetical protein BH09BAC5_BH09BAC5_05190 [soil metagenome]
MKIKFLFFLLFINLAGLFAFSIKHIDGKFEKAQDAYKAGNYNEALSLYLELYRSDTTNSNISYLIGNCYLRDSYGKARAIPYLEKAVVSVSPNYRQGSSKERNTPLMTYKLLGDAYHIHSEFDKAIDAYETYKEKLIFYKKRDKVNLKDAERKIEMCNTAKELMAIPVNVKIENMGKALNSPRADYSPVLTGDQSTMIFTSRRSGSTGGQTYDGGKYYEDIYISNYTGTEWTVAQNIGAPINTDGNEATVGISPDGQEILIYKDDNGDGNIYSTTLNGDVWSTPVKLNANINSSYWEPSAFISADGRAIYF